MKEQMAKSAVAKYATSNIPGLSQASDFASGYDKFISDNTPKQVNQLMDMPYKLKAGAATNLGMPMDTFMSDRDFQRTGTTPPRQNATFGMLNTLRSLYENHRGGGYKG